MAWDSGQYLKFEVERTQPARDLAARIAVGDVRDVLDVGCGPGNSSRVLAERFPGARVRGIDSSPEMIAAAAAKHGDLEFSLCDAGKDLGKLGRTFDVVFSNACIQWIPDHPKLVRDMLGLLRPGGVLAVQTPMNYDEPIHKIIAGLVAGEKWQGAFASPRIFYNLRPGEYFDLLAEAAGDFTLWQTTYYHVLRSHADIMEWYRGTGLRPYLSALPEADRAAFEADVFAEVITQYPKQRDGRIIFRFPRFFFTARPKAA
jgi:trans-aconitate 2-methyltransferase